MTTYFQTVAVEITSTQRTFFSMENAPICPPSYKAEEGAPFILMNTTEGNLIIWWDNGIIIKSYKNGTTKTWYPKATLATAIGFSLEKSNKKAYFEFHADGSVTSSLGSVNYYWSSPINGEIEVGTQIFGYLYDQNTYSDDEIDSYECCT
jgi:hypothetical protein